LRGSGLKKADNTIKKGLFELNHFHSMLAKMDYGGRRTGGERRNSYSDTRSRTERRDSTFAGATNRRKHQRRITPERRRCLPAIGGKPGHTDVISLSVQRGPYRFKDRRDGYRAVLFAASLYG